MRESHIALAMIFLMLGILTSSYVATGAAASAAGAGSAGAAPGHGLSAVSAGGEGALAGGAAGRLLRPLPPEMRGGWIFDF